MNAYDSFINKMSYTEPETNKSNINLNLLSYLQDNNINYIAGNCNVVINKNDIYIDALIELNLIDKNDIAESELAYYIRLSNPNYNNKRINEEPLWIRLAREYKWDGKRRFKPLRSIEEINKGKDVCKCGRAIYKDGKCPWCYEGYTKPIEIITVPNKIGLIQYLRHLNIKIEEDKNAWYIDKNVIIPEQFNIKFHTNDYYHVVRKG